MTNWLEENQRYLMSAIARLQVLLQCQSEPFPEHSMEPLLPESALLPPSALEKLCHIFRLSSFERDVLLLCAGMEFDSNWGYLCAQAQSQQQLNSPMNYPTFSLALTDTEIKGWV